MRTVALIVPRGIPSVVLREAEDVVPEPRLEVALELREVEVRPRSALEQALGVALEVDAEVEEPRRDVLAVDLDVALLQVPAARTDEEHGDLVVQRVALLALLERDRPLDRVREVLLAADDVLPGRRVRVLEVGHVDPSAGVEGVDDHLPIARRAGDLDAAVLEVGRDGRDTPVAFANLERVDSRKPGSSPAAIRSWRSARASSSSSRRPANSRWSATTRSSASGVRTPASSGRRNGRGCDGAHTTGAASN